VLENLSSLATLTLNVREREKFEPPPPVVADFPTQITRTWNNSIHGMVDLGKAVVLWSVDWAAWVPLILIAVVLTWFLLRWLLHVIMRNLPRLIALARTPITPPRGSSGGG
jgi:Flp pilus assembly protein TadB